MPVLPVLPALSAAPVAPVARRLRVQRAAALTSLSVLALVGCGDDVAQSPAQEVQSAVSAVLDTESLTVSVGLDLDDASRSALLELATEQPADPSGGSQLSAEAAERLLDARIVTVLATTDGSDLSELDGAAAGGDLAAGQPGNLSSSVSLVVDGESLVELRQVEGVLYARADAAGLETSLGVPGLADNLTAATAGAPPALAEAAAELASGGWVALDSAELASQMQSMGGADPAATPDAAATAAVEQFLADAKAVLTREVVVTEDGEDAYQVTAPLDRILDGVAPSLTALVGELSGMAGGMAGSGAELDSGIADAQAALAGRSVTVDLQMDGDRLSTVTTDLTQLLDEADRADMVADGVTALPVVVQLTEEGEVEAPDDAVDLDLAGIMEQMMGATAPAP